MVDIFTFSCYQYLSLIYLPSPWPIPSSVYEIISRCPIDRIQVAFESAIGTSWFWSASRTCPIWQFNSSLGLFEITIDLRGIELTPGFSQEFRFKFASPSGNTGVPLQSTWNRVKQIDELTRLSRLFNEPTSR